MKILSDYEELKGQEFESVEACAEAEAKVDVERKNRNAENAKREDDRQKQIQVIKAAEKAYREAGEELKKAHEKAAEIREAARKQAVEVIDPAQAKLREAYTALSDAKAEYNMRFGTPRHIVVRRCAPMDAFLDDVLHTIFG